MPDHSHDNVSSDHANLASASEGQLWDSLSPNERAQILGQSIAGEADNSNIKNSVYQQGEGRAYETTPYTSLPPNVQFEVSNRLHEAGYFQDTYGGNSYEVEGDSQYKCKDCDDEVFTSEEDLRVHRKVNHDDNGESETESQEAYFRSLQIDPDMTKDNLSWARKTLKGEGSRVDYPQNDPPTPMTPDLPKGRKEYDDNPNHYFYDSKLFRRGSRGSYTGQDGVALTEARALIELEEKILNKYGWESTKEIEKSLASRQLFATEVANEVNVNRLHPRTIKILDSVNRPFLVNTLSKIASEASAEDRGDIAPFPEEDPVLHQDYDPEHPHEHNTFDTNFGDKVAEEDTSDYEVDVPEYLKTGEPVQKVPEDKRADEQEEEGWGPNWGSPEETEKDLYDLTHPEGDKDEAEEEEYKGFEPENELSDARTQMKGDIDTLKGFGDYKGDAHPDEGLSWQKGGEGDIEDYEDSQQDEDRIADDDSRKKYGEAERTCKECGFYSADEQELHSHVQDHKDNPEAQEDFPFEDQEERTTVTAEPDLLQNVNTDALQVESEEYDPDEKYDQKGKEARILQQYTGYKPKAGEALGDIMDGAIDTPLEQLTVNETIYDRKLDGYHEDKIARELNVYHDIEYEDAIKRIRTVEVNDNDRTAKTLFGKKFADCNESEVSEMKILGGEVKGKKHDRR